jgi:RND family efflux transporter MFP subunit
MIPKSLYSLGLILLLVGCATKKPQVQAPPPLPVTLKTLESGVMVDSSEFVGTLEARNRVSLAPRIQGRILKINVKEGDRVQTRQIIAELEPSQAQEDVKAAQGDLAIAQANLGNAQAQQRQIEAERDATTDTLALRKTDVTSTQANLKNREAELVSRENELKEAQSDLKLAQKNYQRTAFLVKQGALSRQDLDNDLNALETAQSTVAAKRSVRDAARAARDQAITQIQAARDAVSVAEKNLNAANQRVSAAAASVNSQRAAVTRAEGQLGSISQNLAYNFIKAPIDGVVGNFNSKKVGDFINIGDQLTTITNNKVLDLNVEIPAENLNRLRVGLPVDIIKQDGTPGPRGQVTYIAPSINQNTQSVLTKLTFNNDNNALRDQQYVTAKVIWQENPGVLVPATAVTSIGAQKFVFLANSEEKDGKTVLVAKQVPIQVGSLQGQSYQVISGVKSGDKIAVSRILDLKNGREITQETTTSKLF